MNIIGALSISDSVVDFTTSPELYGARYVTSAVINGTTYVYVAGSNDDGIQILSLAEDGTMTAEGYVQNGGSNLLDLPNEMSVVTVGAKQFLVVTGFYSDAITVFEISRSPDTEGQLLFTDNEQDGTIPLNGATRIEGFTTSGGSFVAVTAEISGAVSTFRVLSTGVLSHVSTIEDTGNADYRLSGAAGTSMVEIGGRLFLYVASYSEDGVNVFSVANNGVLTFVDSVYFGNVSVSDVLVANFNGADLMIVGDHGNDELMVYSVGADGIPVYLSNYDSYALTGSYNGYNLELLEIDGVQFLVTQGSSTDEVQIYSVQADGTITEQQSLSSTYLDGAYDVHVIDIGGRQYILAGAENASRVTALEIGAGDDVLVGSQDDDRMIGLGGNDDMIGRAGNDEMHGGSGEDMLSGRTGNDDLHGGAGADVLLGDAGRDTLEGGEGADYLLGGSGYDFLSYAGSASRVNVNLATGAASGGDAARDVFFDIEGLIGSDHDDILVGDDGDNQIFGGNGGDRILAGAGDDRVNAGAGDDEAFGSNGNDYLIMGDGNDTANGGFGDDTLLGGVGNDRLVGARGNDLIDGQGSRDVLYGQAGDDTLIGGGGRDMFVFTNNAGADVVQDFVVGYDQINLRAVSSMSNFSDVLASSLQIGADVFIIDGTNTIQLVDVNKADLLASDFIF